MKKILFIAGIALLFFLGTVNAQSFSFSLNTPEAIPFVMEENNTIIGALTCNESSCEDVTAALQYCKGIDCTEYKDIADYSRVPPEGEDFMLDSGYPSIIVIGTLEDFIELNWEFSMLIDLPLGETYKFRVFVDSSNAGTEIFGDIIGTVPYYPPEAELIEPFEVLTIHKNDRIQISWITEDLDSSTVVSEVYYAPWSQCGNPANAIKTGAELIHSESGSGSLRLKNFTWFVPDLGPSAGICVFVRVDDGFFSGYSNTQLLNFSDEPPNKCPDLSLTIKQPPKDLILYEKDIFTFEVYAHSSRVCVSNITFQYDQGDGLGTFYRIPDSVYTPENQNLNSRHSTFQSLYLQSRSGGAPEDELPIIYFNQHFASYIPYAVVDCNVKGDYTLRAYSNDPGVGDVYSNTITIYCLENTSPVASFTSPSVPSFVYNSSFRVEWNAFDAEGDDLTYNLSWDGPTSGSAEDLTETYYTVTELELGDYTFLLEVDDGVNSVEVESPVLSVLSSLTTLSVTEFTVVPQSFYTDSSVEFEVTLRNDSPNTVDFKVLFFNADFVPNSYIERVESVEPYSSATVSFQKTLTQADNIEPGDHQLFVFVEEYFTGTEFETETGNEVTSFVNFTILAEKEYASMSETSLLSLFLVAVLVLSLLRAKK